MNIVVAEPMLGGNELRYVTDCIQSNWISSQGEYITKFEDSLAKYLSVKNAIATSNGTTALQLALAAVDIGHGDEVIVPNLTFAATANVVIHQGARPVLVDVGFDDWNIDLEDLASKVTAKTKAIIVVHLYGVPCDIERICSYAKAKGILVIEDCAEAIGAKVNGRQVGTFGDFGCFSFFANKIITTGEGGLVCTNNSLLAKKIRILRDHGMDPGNRYWHLYPGYNFRMTNLQAAVGLAQLEQISSFLTKRKSIQNLYDTCFSGNSGIVQKRVRDSDEPVCWLYTLRFKDGVNAVRAVTEALHRSGIQSRRVFYPLNIQPPYLNSNEYPVSNKIFESGICLPTHLGLSESEIYKIAELVQEGMVLV